MLSPYLILLPIILPVAGGFGLILCQPKSEHVRRLYSEAVVCLTSVLVWVCLFGVTRSSVEIFRFTRGFAISFGLDGLGSLFAGMVSLMWPLVMLYAYEYMEKAERKNGFFGFYVMTYGVTLGVAFASDMTTMYVFFEMLTLVTIPLVTHYGTHDSLYAGRKYAAYTIGGASLGFFTVIMTTVCGDAGGFVYGGSLSAYSMTWVLQMAFLFGFFGFGVKAAVFPFYGWLPTASVAPTPVTALLHAVAVVNSGVFAVMRLCWYIYGPEMLTGTLSQAIALAAAEFTLVFAAVMAVKERHFKRRLAYSTVSNLSYMLFGVLLMTPEGFSAGMLHMLFHGIIKMSLFLCAGAFMHVTGREYLYEINGVGRKMPLTFTLYTLGALSLTGIPLFCGFISKWKLVMAGLGSEHPLAVWGVVALIVSAFLCAIYTLSVSVRAFFPMKGSDRYLEDPGRREAGRLMLLPIVVFSIVNVLFGVYSAPVADFVSKIAAGL